MVKQLLINLITVVVAVFLIAVVAHQFYYRYSPYEQCLRDVEDGVHASWKFGVGSGADWMKEFPNSDLFLHRDYVAKECAQKTHW